MAQFLRSATVQIVFATAFALSIVAGRATRLGGEVALVWPAAAVAIIWFLVSHSRGRTERWISVALLAALTLGTNIATGAEPQLSAWFVLVNVALAVVTVNLLAYRRDEVELRDPGDLARLVAAVTVGTCCAAALATVYMVHVSNVPVWSTFALFAVRNGATALLGVSLWLCVRDVRWKRPSLSLAATIEALLVGVAVAFIFFWTFWLNTGVPMAFLTLVPAMWVALRYSTTVSTMFIAVGGVWIMFATLRGRGVFTGPDLETSALLAQALVGSLTVVVLTLSLYRDSRVRLVSELEAARDQADRDSELLGAVLDSIHDCVLLIDPSGHVVLHNARASTSGLGRAVVSAALAGKSAVSSENPTLVSARYAPRDVVVAAGSPRVVELTTAPLTKESLFQVVAYRDVTEERMNARELREARDLFAGVLNAASEQAIIGTDPSGRITVFNNGAERMLGWTQSEMLGGSPMDFHDYGEVRSRAAELGIPPGLKVFVHNVTPEKARGP